MSHAESLLAQTQAIAKASKAASQSLAMASTQAKNLALERIAKNIDQSRSHILEANAADVEATQKAAKKNAAFINRLTLDNKGVDSLLEAIHTLISLNDPVGEGRYIHTAPNGLCMQQVHVPLGVIFMIYESRPNVTIDAACLGLKSGNAMILRGGSEAWHSNQALMQAIQAGVQQADLDPNSVQLIEDHSHDQTRLLLGMPEYLDLAMPRGGERLITFVTEHAKVPVIKHFRGLCHIFVDASAQPDMAKNIVVNSKAQRPATCNSAETLLIHKDYPHTRDLIEALLDAKVALHGEQALHASIAPATESTFDTEYLDLAMSVKSVPDLDAALAHIRKHSSGHTEAIVTDSYVNSQRFCQELDSAALLVNASTRFHDGGMFGMGAELGISTTKLHGRGPMGLEALTSTKWVVYGQGQTR